MRLFRLTTRNSKNPKSFQASPLLRTGLAIAQGRKNSRITDAPRQKILPSAESSKCAVCPFNHKNWKITAGEKTEGSAPKICYSPRHYRLSMTANVSAFKKIYALKNRSRTLQFTFQTNRTGTSVGYTVSMQHKNLNSCCTIFAFLLLL